MLTYAAWHAGTIDLEEATRLERELDAAGRHALSVQSEPSCHHPTMHLYPALFGQNSAVDPHGLLAHIFPVAYLIHAKAKAVL